MGQHIIPEDFYNHIQSFACGCNPIVTIIEGEEIYYHSEIVDEIPLNNMEEVKEFLRGIRDGTKKIEITNPLKEAKIIYL